VAITGRFVVFESIATNVVPGDANGVSDIFVRDLVAGTTARVSVSTTGGEANGASTGASLSRDGRAVSCDGMSLCHGRPSSLSFIRSLLR
jgi:hypothetical protein